MKLKNILLGITLLLISCSSYAQSIEDMARNTQDQRYKQMSETDTRKVTFGIYGDYTLSPGEKTTASSKDAFTTGIGVGLNIFVPVFTSGDGTNIGNTDGDLTFSAGWKGWASNSDNINYPDWNTYTALVGLRVSFGDLLFIEPQGGYTYGTYSNDYLKTPSNSVSGLTYSLRAGLTLIKGFDLYVAGQSINTPLFGKPIDVGFGFDYHF